MEFIRNAWYVAAWSDEVRNSAFFHRTIVELPILLYRTAGAKIAALLDRCPHRFAPLHRGVLIGDTVQCGYHGLVFNSAGECVRNPRGQVPKGAVVRTFAVEERDGIVWLWMGDPSSADGSVIPDFSVIANAKPASKIQGYLPTACYYELMNDNILDLTHVDYLHATSLGSGGFGHATPEITQDGMSVRIRWCSQRQKAAPIYDPFLPQPGMLVDQCIEVHWHPPGNMLLTNAMSPVGMGPEHVIVSTNVHLMTPAAADLTHYFYGGTRNFAVDDVAVTQARATAIRNAFENEDKPMIEDIQRSMGAETDITKLKPVLLSGDGGAMRARRVVQAMRSKESANAAA